MNGTDALITLCSNSPPEVMNKKNMVGITLDLKYYFL